MCYGVCVLHNVFLVVFRFVFRARVRCCCLLGSCVRFLGTFWGRFRCFACFFFVMVCYGGFA